MALESSDETPDAHDGETHPIDYSDYGRQPDGILYDNPFGVYPGTERNSEPSVTATYTAELANGKNVVSGWGRGVTGFLRDHPQLNKACTTATIAIAAFGGTSQPPENVVNSHNLNAPIFKHEDRIDALDDLMANLRDGQKILDDIRRDSFRRRRKGEPSYPDYGPPMDPEDAPPDILDLDPEYLHDSTKPSVEQRTPKDLGHVVTPRLVQDDALNGLSDDASTTVRPPGRLSGAAQGIGSYLSARASEAARDAREGITGQSDDRASRDFLGHEIDRSPSERRAEKVESNKNLTEGLLKGASSLVAGNKLKGAAQIAGTVAKDPRVKRTVTAAIAVIVALGVLMSGGLLGSIGGGSGGGSQSGIASGASALRGVPSEAADIMREATSGSSVPWPVLMSFYVLFTPDQLIPVEEEDLLSGIGPEVPEDGIYRMGVSSSAAQEAGVDPDDLHATSRWIADILSDVPAGDPPIYGVDILAGTTAVVDEETGELTNKMEPADFSGGEGENYQEDLEEQADSARAAWTTAIMRADVAFDQTIDLNRANGIFDEAVSIAGGLEPTATFGVCGTNQFANLDPNATLGGGSVEELNAEQAANAQLIYSVVSARGLSVEDLVITLMVAKEESGLRNLDYGDRDSIGLFQQRPSQGWGTVAEIMDPLYSTNKFLDTLVAPGLNLAYARTSIVGGNTIKPNVDPDSRHNYDPWLIAQAVQGSGFTGLKTWPNRPYGSEAGGNYKQHYQSAVAWATELAGSPPSPAAMCTTAPGMMADAYSIDQLIAAVNEADSTGHLGDTSKLNAHSGEWLTLSEITLLLYGDSVNPAQEMSLSKFLADNEVESKQVNVQAAGPIVEAALAEGYTHIGKPYVWAAGGPNSFDCSGFTTWVYNGVLKAAGIPIQLPRSAQMQYDWAKQNGTLYDWSQRQRGDLIFWNISSSNSRFIDHVGIYVGKDSQGRDLVLNSQRPPGRVMETVVYSPEKIYGVGRVVVSGK